MSAGTRIELGIWTQEARTIGGTSAEIQWPGDREEIECSVIERGREQQGEEGGGGKRGGEQQGEGGGGEGASDIRPHVEMVVATGKQQLASLPLAIAELCAIAGLSAVGTVITQGERPAWYFQNFPDSWQWVLGLGLDHVYTSPIYLGLLVMLAASLMACTSTTQLPIIKVTRRWSFLKSTQSFSKLPTNDSLPQARLSDLGSVLSGHGYQVFTCGESLYAFKGLPGQLAHIGFYLALVLIRVGNNNEVSILYDIFN